MSHTSYIEGIFRLKTPLHCADPSGGKKNETRTMTMPIITSNIRTYVPYFPANDIRGRLRRKAAKLVMGAICANGKKISRELYSGLTCGSIDANPETGSVSIEEIVRARENVYMGVFGGGKRILRSRFSVSDLVPVIAATVDVGMVPKALAERTESTFTPMTFMNGAIGEAQGNDLLFTRDSFKRDDIMNVSRPEELEMYLKNAIVEVPLYQESVKTAKKGKDDETKKTDIANWYTIQAIAPGTPMYFRLDMDDLLTDAQVGLILQSLCDLVNEQALGGYVRCGFGRYDADLTFVRDDQSTHVFIRNDNRSYRINPALDRYIVAMNEALQNIDADDLAAFFLPARDESEDKKRA